MTPFIGQMMAVGFNFAPKGWTLCVGQILPINQYQALFSLLGTTYGGNGVSTFALPDLRGKAALGFGQGPGLQPYNLGQVAGAESVTLALNTIPSHNHTFLATSAAGSVSAPAGAVLAKFGMYYSDGGEASPVIGQTGGSQAHENHQPFQVLNWCIALQGVFPPRN